MLYPMIGMNRPGSVHQWRVPCATYGLLGVNALLFLYVVALGSSGEAFLDRWGLTSASLTDDLAGRSVHPAVLATIFTAMFLHANLVHLLSNLLFLWVFGERVEQRLGGARFVSLYLAGGTIAAVVQVATTAESGLVAVGSSGAVAAVIGAYLALHPYAPLAGFVPRAFRVPVDTVAVALLGIWVLSQALGGLAAVGYATMSVAQGALWAHLGGFVAGLTLGPLLRGAQRRATPRLGV